jgi:hypothetical protein
MAGQGMAMRKRQDEVFPNAAGIDIGACSHRVAVPRHLAEGTGSEPVREVGAMTEDLKALAPWLMRLGVDTVAVESTGMYWIPAFEVLERSVGDGRMKSATFSSVSRGRPEGRAGGSARLPARGDESPCRVWTARAWAGTRLVLGLSSRHENSAHRPPHDDRRHGADGSRGA